MDCAKVGILAVRSGRIQSLMLYKQPTSRFWWVKLKSGGKTIRRPTKTENKRDALRFEDELRHKLWRARTLDKGKTFGDAGVRWLKERHNKKSISTDLMILEWFAPRLESLLLSEITRDLIEELREQRLEGSSTETVNRYMALLRAILKAARDDWEWIDRIPKVPMYPKVQRPPRFLTWEQFITLSRELPDHLAGPAWFSAMTGLRTAAIRSLCWQWLSRDGARFPPEVMKNSEWLVIPLNQTAWQVLAEHWGQHPERVFLNHKGEPWRDKFTTAAWRKACVKAGLEGVTFHDMRHSWASWKLQAGAPRSALMKLGGWSSEEAMKIYAHHSPSSLSEWA